LHEEKTKYGEEMHSMSLINLKIDGNTPGIRLLGRLDAGREPVALDWTGSGVEFRFRGSDAWARLEAPAAAPIMWMIVLADGCPVTRFPVEPGIRLYPLLLGLEAEQERTVTLMKETQCMPDSPAATVLLHSIRLDGEMTELPVRDRKIEFIGDSLTSGEGALAPRDNQEWITPWFSARGNYSWYACEALNAERHILSQSGWGVCWDWQHTEKNNLSDAYEYTVGVLHGPEAEARGCAQAWDFGAWQPDIVCIRLLTNDVNGMMQRDSLEADRETAIGGAAALIRKVKRYNPEAKIVWILPGSSSHPELAEAAVRKVREEGMEEVYSFALPDYGAEDLGARGHPNAEWNRMAGELLADFLRTL
jgi:hypothetical protein